MKAITPNYSKEPKRFTRPVILRTNVTPIYGGRRLWRSGCHSAAARQ